MTERSLVKACERLESGDATLREVALDKVDARLVRALSRQSPSLKSASFSCYELDGDFASALAKQTQLTRLKLYALTLVAGAASHLPAALRELISLKELTVLMGDAVKDGVECLLSAVGELPQLQRLEVRGQATSDSVKALVEAMWQQGRLRELDLSWTGFGDAGAAHLATLLEHNHTLSVLNVPGCSIGDAGLERLGRALTRNTTLKRLVISGNEFTADGVTRFADMMGDMHGLQGLVLGTGWQKQLLPGVERNYSLLESPFFAAAQPFFERNARAATRARAAVIAWLCICRYRQPTGITRDIGLIIAHHIYASRGQRCWA